MDYINKRTGAILTPHSPFVVEQLDKSPDWEKRAEKPQKTAKATKPKSK